MGIDGLNPFLKEKTPNAIKEIKLYLFRNKTIAIDTSLYFYKFLHKNERFLEGFFQQIYRLKVNDITPIYIFDGKPPLEKHQIIQQRKDKKQELYNLIEQYEKEKKNVTTLEEKLQYSFKINKLKKKLIYVKKEYITDLKNLLEIMNIQYIQAEGEADPICGQLCKDKVIDMVLSDDMDLLTSGANIVLRNFFVGTNKIYCYNLTKILEELEFTREQWIDFCILCGCDYCDRIPGLGPKNAYKHITEYKSIENMLDFIKNRYNVPDNFTKKYLNSRRIFKNDQPENLENNIVIKHIEHPGFANMEKIINILKERTNLSEKQILNRMNAIYKIKQN